MVIMTGSIAHWRVRTTTAETNRGLEPGLLAEVWKSVKPRIEISQKYYFFLYKNVFNSQKAIQYIQKIPPQSCKTQIKNLAYPGLAKSIFGQPGLGATLLGQAKSIYYSIQNREEAQELQVFFFSRTSFCFKSTSKLLESQTIMRCLSPLRQC